MDDEYRLVMAGLARAFLNSKLLKSISYFCRDDLRVDDPVEIPDGKAIRITIEYIDEQEMEQND